MDSKYEVLSNSISTIISSISPGIDKADVTSSGLLDDRIGHTQRNVSMTIDFPKTPSEPHSFSTAADAAFDFNLSPDIDKVVLKIDKNITGRVQKVSCRRFRKALEVSSKFHVISLATGLLFLSVNARHRAVATVVNTYHGAMSIVKALIGKIVKFVKKVVDFFKVWK